MSTVVDIRNELKSHIGEKIEIVEIGSRNRVDKYTGTLTEAYHSVFVIEIDENSGNFERLSYNYIDVLTNAINVKFLT